MVPFGMTQRICRVVFRTYRTGASTVVGIDVDSIGRSGEAVMLGLGGKFGDVRVPDLIAMTRPATAAQTKPTRSPVQVQGPGIPAGPDRLDVASVIPDRLARHPLGDVVGPLLGAWRVVAAVGDVA